MLFAAPDSALALAGAVLTGIGFSLIFPAMGVEAVRRVSPHSRGLAIGGFIAFFDVALGLTAPVAGILADGFGYRAIFLAGAASCLLALAMVGLAAAGRDKTLDGAAHH
jgi:predicted MFS family arabinose efflux permease